MNDHPQRLTVVCPCYNERDVIDAFASALREALDGIDRIEWRVVFVDDGSDDGTLERLNALSAGEPRIDVYSLSRNFGHQIALTAGLDVADGDAVIMMDSDFQHPPSLIAEMVRRWRGGDDVVSGVRKPSSRGPILKRACSRAFYWLINRMTRPRIVPAAADFCLLSARATAALLSMPERHRFLRGMVSWIGFRRSFVEYEAPDRPAGRSKYTVGKMLSLAYDAIFSFSAIPITVAGRVGFVVAAMGLIYLAVILFRFLAYDDLVRGWASLISVVLIIGGLQLAFLGILGQYLARVFEEVKRRPLYFFKQTPPQAGPDGRDQGPPPGGDAGE